MLNFMWKVLNYFIFGVNIIPFNRKMLIGATMKSRRSFFKNVSMFSIGTILIPSVFVHESKAEVTPVMNANMDFANTADIRTSGMHNKHLVVGGVVYDKTGLVPHSNATVEVVLQPSVLQSKKKIRLATNNKGEYQFLLDFPEREEGKSPRLNFNVSSNNNFYSTELIVTDFDVHISGEHWEHNKQLGNKLFPRKQTFADHSEVLFNLSV